MRALVQIPVPLTPLAGRSSVSPEERYAQQAKPVVDYGHFPHRDRRGREYLKAQLRRGDALEVGRIREEAKHPFLGQRHSHGCPEEVEPQASIVSAYEEMSPWTRMREVGEALSADMRPADEATPSHVKRSVLREDEQKVLAVAL